MLILRNAKGANEWRAISPTFQHTQQPDSKKSKGHEKACFSGGKPNISVGRINACLSPRSNT